MSEQREILKRGIIARLDAVARQHKLGNQSRYANRYMLTTADGTDLEVMFEKSEKTPPNIWCLRSAAGQALIADLKPKDSPAALLWQKRNKKGELLYGRHSALEKMPQLGRADLVCFAPKTMGEANQIIDRLLNVTKAELL